MCITDATPVTVLPESLVSNMCTPAPSVPLTLVVPLPSSTCAAPSCLPLQSWLKDAANTFSEINGPFSLGYAILTASLLAAGIDYIVAPGITLPGLSATQLTSTCQLKPAAIWLPCACHAL